MSGNDFAEAMVLFHVILPNLFLGITSIVSDEVVFDLRVGQDVFVSFKKHGPGQIPRLPSADTTEPTCMNAKDDSLTTYTELVDWDIDNFHERGFKGYPHLYGIEEISVIGEVGVESAIPQAFTLEQNFPNPFNPSTTISYGMAKAGHLTLDVYNVMGQKVATLYDGYRDAGIYSVRWDASGFSNGIYFDVMKAEDFTKTEKMMLIK